MALLKHSKHKSAALWIYYHTAAQLDRRRFTAAVSNMNPNLKKNKKRSDKGVKIQTAYSLEQPPPHCTCNRDRRTKGKGLVMLLI